MKIKGLYTAIVTPFTKNGQLDTQGLRENIRYQIAGGVDGITVLGTTGETPTLSDQEKEEILTIAKEECRNRIKLMCGTGSYSTEQTIIDSKLAERFGIDSALIVTPYYNKPTQEGLYLHFKEIARACPNLPIVVYNIQGRTGQNLSTQTLERLVDIPNIVGVKEASGNIIQMMEVIETVSSKRPDFSVLSGDDVLTYALMALGGHGVISVVSNLVPFHVKELVQSLQEGDYPKARRIHYELLPLFRDAFIETNPIPIKAAMNHFGLAAGQCRLPLCNLAEHNYQKLKATLEKYPVLEERLTNGR